MSVAVICRYVCCDMNGFFLKSNMHVCDIRLSVKSTLIYSLTMRCKVFCKKVFLKIFNIYRKKPVPAACLFVQNGTLLQLFKFRQIFKETYFYTTLSVVAFGIFL